MQKYLLPLCFIVLTSSSCESIQNYRAKIKIRNEVELSLRKELSTEFEQTLSREFPRKIDFVDFVLNQTEIEVVDVESLPNNEFSGLITVSSISDSARHIILEIIKPLQGRSINSFNFNDGISLISQRDPNLKIKTEKKFTVKTSL